MSKSPITFSTLQNVFGPCVFLKWPRGMKGDKRKWKHLTLDDMSAKYLSDIMDGNVGIALGQVSNGLCAIDLDDDDLVQPFLEANPWAANTTITKGARGCQIWVRIKGEHSPSAALKRNGKKCGEWRADGCQSIIPPSIHPDTGNYYNFIKMLPVVELSYNDINFLPLLQIGTDKAQIDTDSTDTTEYLCNHKPSLSVPICREEIDDKLYYRDLVAPFVPTEKGANHRLLFDLARRITHLRARGSLVDESQAFVAWHDASKRWTRQNKTIDEYRVEFLEALECVAADNLSMAWAGSATVNAPGAAKLTDPNNRRLAALCFHLSQRAKDGVFYLSCRSVALLFEIHHTDAAKRLKMLTKPLIGLLEVVTAGTPTSGKATRYRYIGKDPKP
jgi:hypothetical protein